MPAYLAHFCILDMAYAKARSEYPFLARPPFYMSRSTVTSGDPLSQWAYLGAMGPDLAGSEDDTEWLFDVIHWKKSNQFAANWLQTVDDPGRGDTMPMNLAFIFGFLSHMAADIIVHPYVNTFAGVYEAQSIPLAKMRTVGIPIVDGLGYAFMPKATRATMHRLVEVEQDSYVANRYFKSTALSKAKRSWGAFWVEVIGSTHESELNSLVTNYVSIANDTYITPTDKKAVGVEGLTKAIKTHFKALDLAYDYALGPIPDKPEMIFVQHPKRDRSYDEYLWAAADLTTKYWKAALRFFYSPKDANDRKRFYEAVSNFNLDNGFAIRVHSNPTRIFIRHDHSWSLLLKKPTQAFDPENPQ